MDQKHYKQLLDVTFHVQKSTIDKVLGKSDHPVPALQRLVQDYKATRSAAH
ncbi:MULTISPECIES: hypothetical protein [unclassified Aeromicrobium]|uniref:hypothetical protein n=1 Tax=unclassified Aeromicrobium TaxID=2633570 RepID=UPI00396B3B0A